MRRMARIHNLSISRLPSLNIHINCQCLEDEQKLAIATSALIRLKLNHTPSIHSRIMEESVKLVFGMYQS